jgi:adenine-specific DNA-methyltransferase
MNGFANILRENPTDAERLLWSRLRSRQLGGFKFRRQRPIGPYICDFVCLEAHVIVELDGMQHLEQQAYDVRRDSILKSNGYRVLRFWNNDVLHRMGSVLETIFAAMQPGETGETGPRSGGGRALATPKALETKASF